MNLRCIYCQTPFTLSRGEMLTAIVQMNEKNMNHYDAHCPRCRRANSISRQRMELFFPNWQEAAKQMPAGGEPAPVSGTQKTEPLPRGLKSAAAIKRPSAKPAAKGKKPAAKKPAAATSSPKGKKTTASKAKAKPAGKKPAKAKKKK